MKQFFEKEIVQYQQQKATYKKGRQQISETVLHSGNFNSSINTGNAIW
ncbi:hypothetical protein [Pedobacter namyangjuensis]|nr:hypothetical protein [Pedobacter namyangjuensis]